MNLFKAFELVYHYLKTGIHANLYSEDYMLIINILIIIARSVITIDFTWQFYYSVCKFYEVEK